MRKSKEIIVDYPVPNDPDGGVVTVRHIPPGEVADIDAVVNHVEMRLVEGEGKLLREGEIHLPKGDDRYLYAVKAVTGWKNFFEEDGKTERPCTPANIVDVCRSESVLIDVEDGTKKLVPFGEFIGMCREKLVALDRARREKIEKNSSR